MGKNSGVSPVEMAAAPLTGTEQSGNTPEAPSGNPYDALFEAVIFSPSDTDKEYPDNDKAPAVMSRKVGSFQAVFKGGFASASGSIYLRRNLKDNTKLVEAVFFGNRQASAVKPHDEHSKAQRNDWLRRTAEQYRQWRKSNGITAGTTIKRSNAAVAVDADEF